MSFLPVIASLGRSAPLTLTQLHHLAPCKCKFFITTAKVPSTTFTETTTLLPRFSADGQNGAVESPKKTRRGRKKKTDADPTDPSPKKTIRSTKRSKPVVMSDAGSEENAGGEGTVYYDLGSGEAKSPVVESKPARRGRKKKGDGGSPAPSNKTTTRSTKSQREDNEAKVKETAEEMESEGKSDEDFDDGMDFPYEFPPLVCCFGAAQREFVPTVRVSHRQMHPDKYSTWKGLQWNPPEFARSPGGPPSNVAISHVRLGGRAAFMGKVGDDDYGNELVYRLNTEKVQTRAVKIDPAVKTATSLLRIKLRDGDGKVVVETSRNCAEDSLSRTEVDVAVLKEAKIFHFNSEVLLSASMHPALFRAIKLSKKFGGAVLFDLNLPLPFWESRQQTWELIEKAWKQADLIEVSKQELEFLLDEEYYERKRNYRPQYYAESYEQTKNLRDYYHYTKEEILPLWHDGIKILFVTDGTLRIHYYTPLFDGVVVGTEDVLITPFTCDRTGSGDAVVAGIMRKLTIHPEMYSDKESLERNLRFAIAAGIISQWTIGAVRGFPTESATQNLKEQVYVPSLW